MTEQLSLPGLDATPPPFRPDVVDSRRGRPTSYTLVGDAFVPRCDAGSDAAIARLRQSLALALIVSHVGIGHHQSIAEWTFADRP